MVDKSGQPVRKHATISDVAAMAKTGKTSISRYLNGELHLLSDDLKKRIEEAIQALDYRPNQMARGLKCGQTRLIGLVLADITNPYSVAVMQGVEAACLKHGFMVVVCNANNEVALELRFMQLLNGYRVDGLIVHSVGLSDASLADFMSSTTPFVLIDRYIDALASDMIGLDNIQAGTLATRHLIEQGYESLLFISEPVRELSSRQERLRAFHETLAEHPGLRGESHEVTLPDEAGLDALIADFNLRHRGMRKAIIAANGVLTLHIAYALRRLGLNWGTDIGFLSFDDLEWAPLAGCGITSIRQPTFEMGKAAVERLVKRIQRKKPEQIHALFPGELVIRGSTSPS